MRILYLSHRLPYPPDKGEKIRAYHQILHLARRHEVHVVSFAEEPRDGEHCAVLQRHCASVEIVRRSRRAAERAAIRALLSRRPLSVAAYDSGEFHRRVEARCRSHPPDVSLVYTVVMAPYAEHLGMPRLIDFVDADSEKWRLYGERFRPPLSWLYGLEADRLGGFEAHVAGSFEHSAFVSEAEARVLFSRVPGLRHTVIPMGVDLDYFHPSGPPAGTAGSPVLVFVGVMNYFPNADAAAWFAAEVLPLVRDEVPDAEFRIVGRYPTRAVRALARRPGVSVTGAVPDVRPHLADAAAAVAPFRIARGVQSKVLEAMASGLPVAGTHLAFQGLTARRDDGVRAADTPEALAGEIIPLLRDPALRRAVGAEARRYVERNHRWEDAGLLLESTLEKLAAARYGSSTRDKGPCSP